MTCAEKLIASFYSKPVTFCTSSDGFRAVEVFNVHTFSYEVHEVLVLAAEIMKYKRMMNRLRNKRNK
jgi:hypothetical protein